jgi:hypothetical protein
MTAQSREIRFRPSRTEGREGVLEVAVSPDRLKLVTADGVETIRFFEIAVWPRPQLFWKAVAALGIKPRWLPVADREFNGSAKSFFRFYTDPPLVIFMPANEKPGPYAETWFVRIRELIHSGGFHTFDLA